MNYIKPINNMKSRVEIDGMKLIMKSAIARINGGGKGLTADEERIFSKAVDSITQTILFMINVFQAYLNISLPKDDKRSISYCNDKDRMLNIHLNQIRGCEYLVNSSELVILQDIYRLFIKYEDDIAITPN